MDGWIELNGGVPPVLGNYDGTYNEINWQISNATGFDKHKALDISGNLNTDKVSETLEAEFFRNTNLSFEGDLFRFQQLENETQLRYHDASSLKAVETFNYKATDACRKDMFADIGMKSDSECIESSYMELEAFGFLDNENLREISGREYSALRESFHTGQPDLINESDADNVIPVQFHSSESESKYHVGTEANDKTNCTATTLGFGASHISSAKPRKQKSLVSRVCKAPTLNTISVKKRSARSSFATQPTTIHNSLSSKEFLNCYKKRRVGSHNFINHISAQKFEQEIAIHTRFSSGSHCTRINSLCSSTLTAGSDQPTISTSKGYPGQFEIDVLTGVQNTTEMQSNVTFGRRLHPNGEFVHTAFTLDPRYGTLDFTQENADNDISLFIKLKHAETKLDEAASDAVAALRSQSEENLRREGQRECSTARLEGVPVGVYRYFQGHLTVEEYKEARMCICWDSCYCNKLCTIYGDIICPCSNAIVLQQD